MEGEPDPNPSPVQPRSAGTDWWRPVDVAGLAFFRVVIGLILLWEVERYWRGGWITQYWIEPAYNFPYAGFEWVVPWPGAGMFVHFAVMAAAAILVLIGLFYRAAVTTLFFAFTYVFLLEEARYLNHFYLVCCLLLVLIFLPANRGFSLDARLWPERRSGTVPAWTIWILRFQIGVPYFYGAIAKLNRDWLAGEPMRDWLYDARGFPVIGRLFLHEPVVYLFTYAGIAIDLLAAPLLLWRPTRTVMFAVVVSFHFLNSGLFSIGIFPWTMIAATLVFFPPAWPRLLWHDLWVQPSRRGFAAFAGALAGSFSATWFHFALDLVPFLVGALAGAVIAWSLAGGLAPARLLEPATGRRTEGHRALLVAAGCWVVFQSLFPLRHYLIEGNVSWTEEGHRFAWHMKLRDKDARIRYVLVDPITEERTEVDPGELLADWQLRKMATRPYMIRQFAHHLSERNGGARVYARVSASLNGRPPHPLIDPEVDLAAEPPSWWKADWILPLVEEDGGP